MAWNTLIVIRYRVAISKQVYIQMASIPHVMSDLCGAIYFIFKARISLCIVCILLQQQQKYVHNSEVLLECS